MQTSCALLARSRGIALLLAATCLLAVSPLAATAQVPKVRLYFGDRRDAPAETLRKALHLRPGVEHTVFVFVRNEEEQPVNVTVELRAGVAPGDVPVAGAMGTRLAPGGNVYTYVPLGAAPAPPPAGQAEAKPPALVPLKPQPIRVRALDDKGKLLDEEEIRIANPADYVQVDAADAYDPATQTLTLKVTAGQDFAGPPGRVELVLRPDRIPSLLPADRREGTFAGELKAPGDEVVLVAPKLRLADVAERNGLVYVTVDGYARAYTFFTTFAASGGKRTPRLVEEPVLRLTPPVASQPVASMPVALEADNLPRGGRLELGFDRNNDHVFSPKQNELTLLPGGRRNTYSFALANGAVRLKGTAEDWVLPLDTTDVFGRRDLRLRLLNAAGQPIKVCDSRVSPEHPSWKEEAAATRAEAMFPEITGQVILDGDPPAALHFVGFPPKLVRGQPIPLQASGTAASGIKRVVFFPGKPGPDGKPPADAKPVEGKLVNAPVPDADKVWAAPLPVPTTAKATYEVTAQFTSAVDLGASQTVVIQLVDAPVVASIEGTVKQGGRGQPGVTVVLRDAQNAARDSVTTDAKGKYIFKSVPAGPYRVIATKTADFTRGETPVEVLPGEQKKDVDLSLKR